jgi:hypothetical protein
MGSFLRAAGGFGGPREGNSMDVATLLIDGRVFSWFGELVLLCGGLSRGLLAGGGGSDAGVLRLGTTVLGPSAVEGAVGGRR